jgi:hypothetical protein
MAEPGGRAMPSIYVANDAGSYEQSMVEPHPGYGPFLYTPGPFV